MSGRPQSPRDPWEGQSSPTGEMAQEAYETRGRLLHRQDSVDHLPYTDDPETPEPQDSRPSVLITFQNSASYYTSYMNGSGQRGPGSKRRGTGMATPRQHKDHPIVIMNEYPSPGPVSVAVSSRKFSCESGLPKMTDSYSPGPPAPPVPPGPPGPPGPPLPNLPSSRRGSLNMNSLELPKKRRPSAIASNTSRSQPSTDRHSPARPNTLKTPQMQLPPPQPHHYPGPYEFSTLPRGPKGRPLKNSLSMPAIAETTASRPALTLPIPSPRPSMASSTLTESQVERQPLFDRRCSDDSEEWTSVSPHPKPVLVNHFGGGETNKVRPQSVYVAEIWPSLVCILTAVLMTLIMYILVSYLYSVPHPVTRTRIIPSQPGPPSPLPLPYPTPYPFPYPYPYPPPPYDRYPHYEPQQQQDARR